MAKTAQPSLEVEVVPIGDLTLDPRNARKHGRRNLDAIKGSLEQFGQRRPLVVRQDLQVIAGNGTLVAMRELGFTEVAVTRVPAGWTDDQVRAYALADNRTAELAEWDDAVLADMLAELDAGGWDLNSFGFDGLAEIAPDDADDEVPEVEDVAIAQSGEVWELGPHRVACGSATDPELVTRLFAGRPAALVVTDPPYGVAYESRGRKTAHKAIAGDATDDADLAELLTAALGLAFVNLEEGGACYVFHGDSKRLVFERAMTEAGYLVHQTLVWVKDSFVLGRLDYQPQHEPILFLSRLIVNSAKKGALVYDPFLGSGSTLIAAERQGRICYGVELEPAYVDVVVRRWQTVTGLTAKVAS